MDMQKSNLDIQNAPNVEQNINSHAYTAMYICIGGTLLEIIQTGCSSTHIVKCNGKRGYRYIHSNTEHWMFKSVAVQCKLLIVCIRGL